VAIEDAGGLLAGGRPKIHSRVRNPTPLRVLGPDLDAEVGGHLPRAMTAALPRGRSRMDGRREAQLLPNLGSPVTL